MEIKAVELCFLDTLNQYTVRIKFLNTCIQSPQSFNLFHHKRPFNLFHHKEIKAKFMLQYWPHNVRGEGSLHDFILHSAVEVITIVVYTILK